MLPQIFEVATNTRIRDLIQNITTKLNLASADGFSIFVKTDDKVHLTFFNLTRHILSWNCAMHVVSHQSVSLSQVLSLNDADYFFDSLRQITDWSKKAKRVKDGNRTARD